MLIRIKKSQLSRSQADTNQSSRPGLGFLIEPNSILLSHVVFDGLPLYVTGVHAWKGSTRSV